MIKFLFNIYPEVLKQVFLEHKARGFKSAGELIRAAIDELLKKEL